MNEKELIKYYNKFNEDKRLKTKHAKIEYLTTIKYLKDYLKPNSKILDIGAGTGAYTIPLFEEGYEIDAVELVKHNLKVIEKKNSNIKCFNLNATNLSKIKDSTYDITLLFGPMYHLITKEEKIKALNEAKRVTKKKGLIFISYCMNEYALITHGFIENELLNELDKIDNNYKIKSNKDDLYSFVRLEDIDELNKLVNLKRIKIISQDGPSEYLKKVINKMEDKTYNRFIDYHFKTCEDINLLGASRHLLDILKNTK